MMLVNAVAGLAIIVSAVLGSAQEISQIAGQCLTLPYCSDSKRNDAGELINMDYFIAKEDSETTHLLHLVETAHTNRVLSQIGKNDYGGALSDIKYTLNRFPNHPVGLVLMGVYARLTKTYALAIPYFEKAIRLFPQHALTHAQYGAYMITLGSTDRGIKKLHQAVEMNPKLVLHTYGSRLSTISLAMWSLAERPKPKQTTSDIKEKFHSTLCKAPKTKSRIWGFRGLSSDANSRKHLFTVSGSRCLSIRSGWVGERFSQFD
jgi:tetratricopeptide (TPR) repeat protein